MRRLALAAAFVLVLAPFGIAQDAPAAGEPSRVVGAPRAPDWFSLLKFSSSISP